ncbi:EVE domain-containing protein [Sphingobacteriales bacterium UPWRP_1]|nr:ubiquinol-cytochrome C reductase [Sphingobacteriales bacterium TSM_CSM]PSJ72898.1 EVE domain-containing protein [Sphingobacteriales bacterium UPWRP_1]
MNYWLIKSDPDTYGWNEFVAKGTDMWEGVRNYQARNNLMAMKTGDLALFYHSVLHPAVVGIARVVKEHYPDPTTDDKRWVVVDFTVERALPRPVTLKEIKEAPPLANIALIRQSRLSVMPLTEQEYNTILQMAGQ